MTVSVRAWADEDDFAAMRALMSRIYALTGPQVYATLGDLEWWRAADEDPQAAVRARLAFAADGSLLGFAWPSDSQVDLIGFPDRVDIAEQLLEAVEDWRRSSAATADDGADGVETPGTLPAWSMAHLPAWQEMLQRRGYSRGEGALCMRARSLVGALPQAALPPGYTLRPLDPDRDVEARVAAHRDAFGSQRMTVARHLRVMQTATYRGDLDLVIVAPEGEIAAYTTIWFDPSARQGTFEPVGVRAAHQRRGLGRALMHAGFQRLQALGATHVNLTSAQGDEGANLLYDAVGMLRVVHLQSWEKTL